MFALMGRIRWRLFLAGTSTAFLVAGILTLLDAGRFVDGFGPDGGWFALAWLPAGAVGLALAIVGRLPVHPLLFDGLPTLFALGAFGRAGSLYLVEAWVGGIGWLLVGWLIAVAWSRLMAPPVAQA